MTLQVELVEHVAEVSCLAAEPGAKWAASGGTDGEVIIWSVDAEKSGVHGCVAARLEPHETMVTAIAWTADGCFVSCSHRILRLHRILVATSDH